MKLEGTNFGISAEVYFGPNRAKIVNQSHSEIFVLSPKGQASCGARNGWRRVLYA